MFHDSQPLNIDKLNNIDNSNWVEPKIKSQYIGRMFDFDTNIKIKITTKIKWFFERNIKDKYYDYKYTICNHIKWHQTMKDIRSWNGYHGMMLAMITHLKNYIEAEEKYGYSEENYKNNKIITAKETVSLLERMINPDRYSDRIQKEVKDKYPKYQYLISEYVDGGLCYSGNFIQQDNGWVGIEDGKNPKSGYFEMIDGKYELVKSPDNIETNRLLKQIKQYRNDMIFVYEQAKIDSDKDFNRLHELLKENMYSWWD